MGNWEGISSIRLYWFWLWNVKGIKSNDNTYYQYISLTRRKIVQNSDWKWKCRAKWFLYKWNLEQKFTLDFVSANSGVDTARGLYISWYSYKMVAQKQVRMSEVVLVISAVYGIYFDPEKSQIWLFYFVKKTVSSTRAQHVLSDQLI